MKSNKKLIKFLLIAGMGILLAACDENASQKSIGNSADTGNYSLSDTATINKAKRDSARSKGKDSMAKGNADPSGRMNNQ